MLFPSPHSHPVFSIFYWDPKLRDKVVIFAEHRRVDVLDCGVGWYKG